MGTLFKPSIKKSEESFYNLKSAGKEKNQSQERTFTEEKDRRLSSGVIGRLSIGTRIRSSKKKRSGMSSPDLLAFK